VLVVCGEAGIGKSALLAAAARLAADSGVRVLSATGIQAEARLPFAGLHQLLRRSCPWPSGLPPLQRAGPAVGVRDGRRGASRAVPDRAGGAGTDQRGGVGHTGAAGRDDAQWLDEPSCAVLGFVARRLAAERRRCWSRPGTGSPARSVTPGCLSYGWRGLTESAATALLDARAPGLDRALRHRLLAEAAGNPLALVELPKAVRPGLPASRGLPPPLLPLTARLERAFAAQESELPAATRTVLLAAAA